MQVAHNGPSPLLQSQVFTAICTTVSVFFGSALYCTLVYLSLSLSYWVSSYLSTHLCSARAHTHTHTHTHTVCLMQHAGQVSPWYAGMAWYDSCLLCGMYCSNPSDERACTCTYMCACVCACVHMCVCCVMVTWGVIRSCAQ